MFNQVLKSIEQYGSFSPSELTLLTEKLQVKKLQKNEFLLQKGQVCQSLYFIDQGALRHYQCVNSFTELTLNLLTENDWAVDYQSFTSQKKSENYIQAFEESEVVALHMESIHELINQSQSYFKLMSLLELGLHNTENYHTQSPEEKYKKILSDNPMLIQRFPLKYIASYLRITPETLSRVRKKIM